MAQAQSGKAATKNVFDRVPDVRLAAADKEEKEMTGSERETTEVKKSSAADEMEDIQSFNTYTSLEDGQPGQPGELQINYFNGWETTSGESDPWLMKTEIEYTFKQELLRNTKLGLAVPLELGNGGVDGNGDIEFAWKQRWIAEEEGNWWPTFSTINEIRIPSGYHSEKVDWTLTGVLAKNIGPGTAYVNAWLKSANGSNNLEDESTFWDQLWCEEKGEDLRNFQWGFRFGYKWRLSENFAIIPAYIMESSELRGGHNQNRGEISAEWRVNEQLSIGPGILFGLDGGDETPHFGAGITLHYEWIF